MKINYRLHTVASAPGRIFAYGENQYIPVGVFKDNDTGTEYTSSKCPKGLFDLLNLKASDHIQRDSILEFVRLIDEQKIPNVPFKVTFVKEYLTEDGWKEFLNVLYPSRKTKAQKKADTRRYYLHKVLDPFCRIYPTEQRIAVRDFDFTGIPSKHVKHIEELKTVYKYSVQLEIPDANSED